MCLDSVTKTDHGDYVKPTTIIAWKVFKMFGTNCLVGMFTGHAFPTKKWHKSDRFLLVIDPNYQPSFSYTSGFHAFTTRKFARAVRDVCYPRDRYSKFVVRKVSLRGPKTYGFQTFKDMSVPCVVGDEMFIFRSRKG